MDIIPASFYRRENVVIVAKELLGKILCTRFEGVTAKGVIIETEAYAGVTDRASHAFGGRRTYRTEVMYSDGGTAYVYLCYGIHSLFNIVTNIKGIPDAVLIRAIKPFSGVDAMLKRAGKSVMDKDFGRGPGRVCKVMGIHYSHTGMNLTGEVGEMKGDSIWLESDGTILRSSEILTGPRVGVDYAGDDALRPYRFRIMK